jgi:hypothetical protein
MRLDSFLPGCFVREVHHFAVKASPAEAFAAFCDFDMARISWIRTLFRLRTFLDRGSPGFPTLTLRDAYKNGGFHLLQEIPGEELVVGAIGKIWKPKLAFEEVEPEQFNAFNRKGFAKVAWSLKCEPLLFGNGTLGTFEVRVGATDSFSAAKMRGYYSTIRPFSRGIRRSTIRHLTEQLGDAYSEEKNRTLPGDDIIPNPSGSWTHAITIDATPDHIWPWLVQMGCLRAGWYSYDWLDNGGIPSAFRIVPDWQNLNVGDALPATPQSEGMFYVSRLQAFRTLVLGGCYDLDSSSSFAPDIPLLPENYWRSTWIFYLEPQTQEVTRLIVRARGDFRADEKHHLRVRNALIPYIHDFMEREQLRNLKRRAEGMQQATSLSFT